MVAAKSPVIPEDTIAPDTGPSGHQVMAARAISSDWGLDNSGQGSTSSVADSTMLSSTAIRQRMLTVSERFINSLAQSGQKSTTGQMSLLDASGYTIADSGYLKGNIFQPFVFLNFIIRYIIFNILFQSS